MFSFIDFIVYSNIVVNKTLY